MYLYGASGHAKVIIDILESRSVVISGLFDDNPHLQSLNNISVLGSYKGQKLDGPLIISIGENRIRAKIAKEIGTQQLFGKATHCSALISPSANIDEGTVVMQCAIVQASTVIGKHVIVNTGASIDHDCFIGNFAHISPGAVLSGNVKVGEGTHIGAGAVIIPGIRIGKWCKIGAGAVVIKNIPDYATAVGNPTRILKTNRDE
jgi:sugar O-acyltransferase (sialic acid O-acetyltransferase NeuD family)